jgi:hypothetical protein
MSDPRFENRRPYANKRVDLTAGFYSARRACHAGGSWPASPNDGLLQAEASARSRMVLEDRYVRMIYPCGFNPTRTRNTRAE